jgi:hypothetical protein
MNPDQCHDFCKLVVKGMVQVQQDRQRGRCGAGCAKAAIGTLDVPASSAQPEFNYLSHTLRKNGFLSVW